MLLQSQHPSLRPLTTAHLAQTMTLLELTGAELRQKIEAELASNPALELMDERHCPICGRPQVHSGPCPLCSSTHDLASDQPIVFVSPRSDFTPSYSNFSEDEFHAEDLVAEIDDLPTFVLRQIAVELDPADRAIAANLLTSLDEDGILRQPMMEFARYHHVPLSRIEKVVSIIQHAEPVGVGSPSPQAALLVQLEVLAETTCVPKLAARAVQEGMELLSRRAFHELAELLNVSAVQAQEIAQYIIDNLYPYPARSHWGDVRCRTDTLPLFRDPDIILTRLNDTPTTPLVVEIVSPYAGALRVNPLFREALSQAPVEKDEHWQGDFEQANLLVKCLQQRNHTLVRLMERLVVLQRSFILEGDAHLSPITRAQLALELEVHESTVSRAVSGKEVQLPNKRVVPLSKLFDPSLHIRTALRAIIDQENKPLSDTQLANLLGERGYPVARRTVAKYRAMEGILSARYRRLPMVSLST